MACLFLPIKVGMPGKPKTNFWVVLCILSKAAFSAKKRYMSSVFTLFFNCQQSSSELRFSRANIHRRRNEQKNGQNSLGIYPCNDQRCGYWKCKKLASNCGVWPFLCLLFSSCSHRFFHPGRFSFRRASDRLARGGEILVGLKKRLDSEQVFWRFGYCGLKMCSGIRRCSRSSRLPSPISLILSSYIISPI